METSDFKSRMVKVLPYWGTHWSTSWRTAARAAYAGGNPDYRMVTSAELPKLRVDSADHSIANHREHFRKPASSGFSSSTVLAMANPCDCAIMYVAKHSQRQCNGPTSQTLSTLNPATSADRA